MDCLRCKRPIDQHTASRETDACAHVVVMGRYLKPDYAKCLDSTHCDCWPWYSKDIGDAWAVVEKIEESGLFMFTIRTKEAWIESMNREVNGRPGLSFVLVEQADSDIGTAHAISLVALKWALWKEEIDAAQCRKS